MLLAIITRKKTPNFQTLPILSFLIEDGFLGFSHFWFVTIKFRMKDKSKDAAHNCCEKENTKFVLSFYYLYLTECFCVEWKTKARMLRAIVARKKTPNFSNMLLLTFIFNEPLCLEWKTKARMLRAIVARKRTPNFSNTSYFIILNWSWFLRFSHF